MTIDELRIHAAQKLQEINEYLEGAICGRRYAGRYACGDVRERPAGGDGGDCHRPFSRELRGRGLYIGGIKKSCNFVEREKQPAHRRRFPPRFADKPDKTNKPYFKK